MATLAEKLDKIKSPKLQNQHHVRSYTTAQSTITEYSNTHIHTYRTRLI